MSGICSVHRHNDPGCRACQSTPEDLFGKESWQRALAAAKAAGEHVCRGPKKTIMGGYDSSKRCGFKFYRTVDYCPLCGHKIEEEEK
jgi:hypothetical protein